MHSTCGVVDHPHGSSMVQAPLSVKEKPSCVSEPFSHCTMHEQAVTLEAWLAGGVYAQLVRRQLQPGAAPAAPSDPAKELSPGPFAAVAFEAGSPEDQLLASFSDAAAAAGEDRNAVAADAQVAACLCTALRSSFLQLTHPSWLLFMAFAGDEHSGSLVAILLCCMHRTCVGKV